jgi:hypothetical protein
LICACASALVGTGLIGATPGMKVSIVTAWRDLPVANSEVPATVEGSVDRTVFVELQHASLLLISDRGGRAASGLWRRINSSPGDVGMGDRV